MTDTQFALLAYGSLNLGDDIQSEAARAYLPGAARNVDRDALGELQSPSALKLIMNGWFMGRPSWPPAPCIHPLYTSFHIGTYAYAEYGGRSPAEWLLGPQGIEYLRQYEPIGCRDLETVELLDAVGVKCHFSGCLTLTISAPQPAGPREEILIVDPNADVGHLLATVPPRLRGQVHEVTHQTNLGFQPETRRGLAQQLLQRYAGARLVITSRLHCLLPCLALGTPVLFIEPAFEAGRLRGYEGFFHTLDCVDGRVNGAIPWEQPEQNPVKHVALAQALRASVSRFVAAPLQVQWKDIEYFDASWKERIAQMAEFIPASASVLDLGCGQEWLRDSIGAARYTGVDYKPRSAATLVCDFNHHEFPSLRRDVAFVSGCLEYVEDPEWFIREICCAAGRCILSYCLLDTHPNLVNRRRIGWVNDLCRQGIITAFARNGFSLTHETVTRSNNAVFVFDEDREMRTALAGS